MILSFIGGTLTNQHEPSHTPVDAVVINSSNMEIYFTRAGDKPEQALIEVIAGSQETLDIAIYSLTHPDIVAAIRDAANRGVRVRIIEDKQQAGGKSQKEALKLLGSAGAALKINKHSGLMHLKTTIADGEVVTGGSFNYSKAASTGNDEVLTIYRSPQVARDFTNQFEAMWTDDTRFEPIDRYIAMPEQEEKESISEVDGAGVERKNGCENPTIKGNLNSMIYHIPGGQSYDQTTRNIEYFCTEQEAQDAGYRKAGR